MVQPAWLSLATYLNAVLWFSSVSFSQGIFNPEQPQPELDQFSAAARCPLSCSKDGPWALYSSLEDLSTCDKTILFETNLYNEITSSSSAVGIRSCVATEAASRLKSRQTFVVPSSNSTPSTFDSRVNTVDLKIRMRNGKGDDHSISEAVSALSAYVQNQEDGTTVALFAKYGNSIVGIYGGLQLEKKSLSALIRNTLDRFQPQNAKQAAVEYCKDDSLSSQMFGIFVDNSGDVATVQAALRGWSKAECLSGAWDSESIWDSARISMVPGSEILVGPSTGHNNTIFKRATCSYTQAVSGDGCWALADRCKITQAQLVQFNGDTDLCSANKIQVGKYYCCSAGTLPDFTPQPNADGTCKTHTVASTDLCYSIAQKYSMTTQQLENRNKNTWGWQGCSFLMKDQRICVSLGSPPMPAVDPLATCGPTVAGTQRPSDMSKLNELNPCPLKACCNVWGNCGISKDFCIKNPADTGAPGTTKPGANSCIASCGMNITNNGSPPSTYRRIGYFEAWNLDRPCLRMLPRQVDLVYYTHLVSTSAISGNHVLTTVQHFAFADISSDFNVQLGKLQPMFEDFKKLTGVKKIMSFGGWSFSTEADTYPIFRQGVTAAQRTTFANNVAQFAIDNNLDGLDFDWEYPGELQHVVRAT